ncbi:MAG: SDR family oxidoreductase [Phycisphaerales bacterium]|nr:MAG: SDR family oxidoreductase [Phycisphaerales bacterium]
MDLGLLDRVAIVSASSEGLGRAAALDLAREGARLALCARTDKTLQTAAQEIRQQTGADVFARTCDVSDPDQIDGFVAKVAEHYDERIDILVNNAGGPPPGTIAEVGLREWRIAFDRTFASVVRFCQQVVPYMQRRKWGRIITITSSSTRQPIDGLATSNAMRPAIVGFAKTLSRELAPHNILVNNVAPGMFRTARHEELLESMATSQNRSPEEILQERVAQVPLGRMGDPDEHAHMITFLASERASYITGQTIAVDGGLVRGL